MFVLRTREALIFGSTGQYGGAGEIEGRIVVGRHKHVTRESINFIFDGHRMLGGKGENRTEFFHRLRG